MTQTRQLFAFACRHKDRPEWKETIYNAETASKARYQYWLDVTEPYPAIRLIDLRVRKLGPAHSSEDFKRCAAYRGLPDLRCGHRVKTRCGTGIVVGHNHSANFNILFEDGDYTGRTLSLHPTELEATA